MLELIFARSGRETLSMLFLSFFFYFSQAGRKSNITHSRGRGSVEARAATPRVLHVTRRPTAFRGGAKQQPPGGKKNGLTSSVCLQMRDKKNASDPASVWDHGHTNTHTHAHATHGGGETMRGQCYSAHPERSLSASPRALNSIQIRSDGMNVAIGANQGPF